MYVCVCVCLCVCMYVCVGGVGGIMGVWGCFGSIEKGYIHIHTQFACITHRQGFISSYNLQTASLAMC